MNTFNTIMLGMMGGYEWVLIILIVVLLFGGRKIPELMKGLGQGIKEFKNAKDSNTDVQQPKNNGSIEK